MTGRTLPFGVQETQSVYFDKVVGTMLGANAWAVRARRMSDTLALLCPAGSWADRLGHSGATFHALRSRRRP